MFENLGNFFKKIVKTTEQKELGSKDAAKERLHLVLMQDRANVSADFLELMKQEIIDVIKKYIIVDESAIDVRLTNQSNEDETNGAPALYANIPIINIKNDMKSDKIKEFEGVNFNNNIDNSNTIETEKSNKQSQKDNLNIKNEENNSKNKIIENENEKLKSKNDKQKKEDEKNKNKDLKIEKNIEENVDEEDDEDDVTFDDLLKAAEEEDKKQKAKEEKK